jgi:hypothetical protein
MQSSYSTFKQPKEVARCLAGSLGAFRTARHKSTIEKPFEIRNGRKSVLLIENIFFPVNELEDNVLFELNAEVTYVDESVFTNHLI